ncbi:MAG: hypothetical protein MJK13_11950 [Pseudomonadales bacterium]|nr:hypothetical protein [Pseudomonadales bacterium]
MYQLLCAAVITSLLLSTMAAANSCVDKLDSYSDYDNLVAAADVRTISSEYYLLSYSWSPAHCLKVSAQSKRAGGKNYLQCGSEQYFGYILHGLWPQGSRSGKGGYPRACLGDQGKIDRTDLQPFLCMTPSVWLLQHEYEYHGTCMPQPSLRTPGGYFGKARELHQQLKLPLKQLSYTVANLNWWYKHNPQLASGSIKYWQKGQEWQFCYDRDFKSTSCLFSTNNLKTDVPAAALVGARSVGQCTVKGNISKRSGRKYYFLQRHLNYQSVVINKAAGERCFDTEHQARAAGWLKAPN